MMDLTLRRIKRFVLTLALLVSGGSAFALELSYGGRLTDETGAPLAWLVDFLFNFYDASSGGTPLVTLTRRSVLLVEGTFQVSLDLIAAETATLFGDGDRMVYIEVQEVSQFKTL